jgi:hypothetical protein
MWDGTDLILAGTLECISAYLAVQDVPSKPTPPRILSTTYDAIAKRARRRALYRAQNQVGLHDDARETNRGARARRGQAHGLRCGSSDPDSSHSPRC